MRFPEDYVTGARVTLAGGLPGKLVGHGIAYGDPHHLSGRRSERYIVLVDVGTWDKPALYLEGVGQAVSIIAADPSVVDLVPETAFDDEPTNPDARAGHAGGRW